MNGSPADPDRLYASQSSGWFGQIVQRSDDGGSTWETVGNEFAYDGVPARTSGTTAHSIRGSSRVSGTWSRPRPIPTRCSRASRTRPSSAPPTAGTPGRSLARAHETGEQRQPGAGGLCLHTILIHPEDPARMVVAISAAGAFRTDDGGETRPINRGLRSAELPDEDREVGHCVHRIAMNPSQPDVLFMQKHWDVMRSDDGGESWHEVSGNLPTDFGFPIAVHPHEPETVYVVPIKSDSEHIPPDGKLRVYRSRTGERVGGPDPGLPQSHCYVNVLRDSMAVDSLDPAGIYFGTSGGQVYASSDAGDNWNAIVRDLPPVLSVEAQTLP